MANAVVDSSDPRVAQLAKQIISTQEGEIEQLRPLAGS
jgi:uncharacterized protein (DUF305 family)